ncbi:YARHG domain-containing protein [Sphingobacterium hotanense]|uniref:YARHG domain-containing protein n=1 Tax=Sphingobacterium hotanense TaxID=649196 RepID=UPI0021A4E440|nr:YARHG domain-containing protein [Sphingobacterium hotanense]MCT1526619.1 YARHG domain-containing protein [Sphingobacterium hotanense]
MLTAANRWANKQIDDFTLNVEMENFEDFIIDKTFFKSKDEWKIDGVGKVRDIKANSSTSLDRDALEFTMREGKLVFQKKNFRPKGELSIYSNNVFIQEILGQHNEFFLPFSIYKADNINLEEPISSLYKKLLRNLPFARRGYVFNDPKLKKYYESVYWYMPDPKYSPAISKLHKSEQDWIEKWK